MTTLTLRLIKDHFVVTGPDIEPMRFKSRVPILAPPPRAFCFVPAVSIGHLADGL